LCDAIELTHLQNPVEVHIPLALHIVYVNPLSRDHWLAFVVENREVPILMKEGPEPLISAPFLGCAIARLVSESDMVPWIHLESCHDKKEHKQGYSQI
jgi:hypothetical protein